MARIRAVLEKNIPAEIKEENGRYKLSYGALKSLTVWVDNKKLCVETESSKDVLDEQILDTNKRYRNFLDEATGLSSKDRLKKAKKEVQGV